jgi:hypothetical protein
MQTLTSTLLEVNVPAKNAKKIAMTFRFREHFFLMAIGRYDYGDHVSDPLAFKERIKKLMR